MFCSKCAKEIAAEAVICPFCGCATANFYKEQVTNNNSSSNKNEYSKDYVAIKKFESDVKGFHSLSVVCAVLCLGIGIIFTIIAWLRAKSIVIPTITTKNPNEIFIYEQAKKKLNTALVLSYLPFYVLLILGLPCVVFPGEIGIIFAAFAVFALLLLLAVSCTKHLNTSTPKKT